MILKFLGVILLLFFGAGVFHCIGQSLEGRKTTFLHFGWMTLIATIGAISYSFWGWISTIWVLGFAAAWTVIPGLWVQFFSKGKPSGYFYHGDNQDDKQQ